MDKRNCAGCGNEIIVSQSRDISRNEFQRGTFLRCENCGQVFYLGESDPKSITVSGAEIIP